MSNFTQEQVAVQQTAREFARTRVAPVASQLDKEAQAKVAEPGRRPVVTIAI